MANLADVLYAAPDVRRTPLSLLRWWESRRPLYNGVVGCAGVVTLWWVYVFAALPPYPMPLGPVELAIGAVVYGVMANVCYTFGWLTELVARWAWGRRAPDLGPLFFREGLIFSVGLTLFPIALAAVAWVARVVAAVVS